MSDREDIRIRVIDRKQDGGRQDVADLTPGERIGLMWQLARDAWTFKGEPERAESRLQRHVARFERRGS